MLTNETSFEKKAKMYALISSMENDFIDSFAEHLTISCLSDEIKKKSNRVTSEPDLFLSYLRGLDIQSYIEICNTNIETLGISLEQKRFINGELSKLIPIRNRVMHPRLLELMDLPTVETITRELSKMLPQFAWKHLGEAINKVDNDPSSLDFPLVSAKKGDKIIENLPTIVDFEETSFIGRRKEIGEIKDKLNKRNVHVLSIIGDGGIGKTALVLKMLYDMLDDDNTPFEMILWVSLKTNELNGYEFEVIKDSINSTSYMYEKLGEFVGATTQETIPDYLIELAKNFNTLLVLDNLETLNTDEVKEFIDNFSEYGKVLITSRIGLGEMEYRYKLAGLSDEDVLNYMNTLLELFGFVGLFSDEDKLRISTNELHANPLAIKWFVKSLYSGKDVDTVLNHKDDLIGFCMSNVYEKLGETARKILSTIQIASFDMSFGELVYYTDSTYQDTIELSNAINELIKCNFLDDTKFRTNKLLSITQFASEFLKLHLKHSSEERISIVRRGTEITQFTQQLTQNRFTHPLSTNTFMFCDGDKDKTVAALYYTKAIKSLNKKEVPEKAMEYAQLAKKIAPSYAEGLTVMGICYAESSPQKVLEEFSQAQRFAKDDREKALVLLRFARHLRKTNAFQEAVEKLEEAHSLDRENIWIKFELIMNLCWVNNFDRARQLFGEINYECLPSVQKIEYNLKYADMLRREAEALDQSRQAEAMVILMQAFDVLEKCPDDSRKYDTMAGVLCAMSYLYLDKETVDYIIEKLSQYYNQMKSKKRFSRFKESMIGKLSVLKPDKRQLIEEYLIDFNAIIASLGKNQGVVTTVKEGHILFRINGYNQYVYCSTPPVSIKVGDIVTYEKIYPTAKGLAVSRVMLVKPRMPLQ